MIERVSSFFGGGKVFREMGMYDDGFFARVDNCWQPTMLGDRGMNGTRQTTPAFAWKLSHNPGI
jgi:hypothetical protein